jgi:hypothetical protein
MSIILIIVIGLAVIIFWMSKSKKTDSINAIPTTEKLQRLDVASELDKFPDRTDAILFHKQSILKAVAAGNFELANLSFAKLVESVRQQNINLDGMIDKEHTLIREIYKSFREKYRLEYPPQFLPPQERTTKKVEVKSEDSYLKFDGPLNPKTPKEFIPLLDTIKKKSAWEAMGFKLKADKYGNYKPVRKNGLFFGFREVTCLDEITEKAFRIGKKYTTYPKNILSFLNYGCSYDDFVSITDDIKAYCEAFKYYENDAFESALTEISKARELNPTENIYKELFFDIKFELKDISAIDGDIAYHIETYGGISAMAHCEKTDRWIKLLRTLGEHQKMTQVVDTINRFFDEEISKKSVYKKPEGVKYIVNGSEEAGEQLAITAHNNELDFVKSRKEKFNERVSKLKEKLIRKAKKKEK